MKIGLFGAGGFAREVFPILQLLSKQVKIRPVFVVEFPSANTKPTSLLSEGVECLEKQDFMSVLDPRYVGFNVAIADSRVRRRIAEELERKFFNPFDIIADTALIGPGVKFGKGAILCHNTTLTADLVIGKYFHCNIYSYVAHDCEIGDYVTLAPRVSINGECKVGNHAYIGTGAVLLPGIKVGVRAIVGAGAIVTRDVPDGATVVGNPARIFEETVN